MALGANGDFRKIVDEGTVRASRQQVTAEATKKERWREIEYGAVVRMMRIEGRIIHGPSSFASMLVAQKVKPWR
jgi:phage I-like protein